MAERARSVLTLQGVHMSFFGSGVARGISFIEQYEIFI